MPTFSPPENPGFPLPKIRRSSAVVDAFGNQYIKSRSRVVQPLRMWPLNWNTATQETIDYLEGFFAARNGPAEAFDWELFCAGLYHPKPVDAPTLGSTAGGSIGARTYQVAIAWGNANGDTQIGPVGSLPVPANELLTVTAPRLRPRDATFIAVYVKWSTSPVFLRQGTISGAGGTLTEPTGGFIGSIPANSTNEMKATVRVGFNMQEFAPTLRTANTYRARMELIERLD